MLVLHAIFCLDKKKLQLQTIWSNMTSFFFLFFRQSQSFLVSTHDAKAFKNVLQSSGRFPPKKCKHPIIVVALKSDITSFVLLIVTFVHSGMSGVIYK